MAFDAQEILSSVPTENQGPKALTPAGIYPNCTIGEVTAHEKKEWDAEDVVCNLRIAFNCDTKGKEDIELYKFVKIKESGFVAANSNLGMLRSAVWPDPEVREGKSHEDLAGESVTISVSHQPSISPGGKEYAGYHFSPAE